MALRFCPIQKRGPMQHDRARKEETVCYSRGRMPMDADGCRWMPMDADGRLTMLQDGVTFHHDVFRMFPDTSNRGRSGPPSG